MKRASHGRVLFGAAAVVFGVIALLWHDADTWQEVARIWKMPFGVTIGVVLMVAQIIGGLLLMFPRSVRVASILLLIVYGVFSLASASGILAAPRVFGEYDGFFEQFCLLCGAIAVYASTDANRREAAAMGHFARIGLALCAVSFTVAQIVYPQMTASLVPRWIPPNQMFWAVLTTVAFALAAIAVLINRRARLAIRLMTLMLVLFGALVWVPMLIAQPSSHGNWSEFALTLLIAGASWTISELRSF